MKVRIGNQEAIGVKRNIAFTAILSGSVMLWALVNELLNIEPHSYKLIHDLSMAYIGIGFFLIVCVLVLYYNVDTSEKVIKNCFFSALTFSSLILAIGIMAYLF